MFSVIPLEKQHFHLVTDYYNRNNQAIQIIHPDFKNRGGYVLFFTNWCGQCQDTKVGWFALGIVKGTRIYAPSNNFGFRRSGVQRFPELKFVRKDGVVVDSPQTEEDAQINIREMIDFACKTAGLGGCCQHLSRNMC